MGIGAAAAVSVTNLGSVAAVALVPVPASRGRVESSWSATALCSRFNSNLYLPTPELSLGVYSLHGTGAALASLSGGICPGWRNSQRKPFSAMARGKKRSRADDEPVEFPTATADLHQGSSSGVNAGFQNWFLPEWTFRKDQLETGKHGRTHGRVPYFYGSTMFHGTFSWVLEPLLPLRIKFASAEHIVHSTALVPARTQENPCADAQGVLHLLGFHILMVARRNPAPIEALAHYLEGFNHPIHCMFDGELPIFCRTHPQNPKPIRKPPGPMLATLDGLQGPARRGWRSTSVTMFCQNAFFVGNLVRRPFQSTSWLG